MKTNVQVLNLPLLGKRQHPNRNVDKTERWRDKDEIQKIGQMSDQINLKVDRGLEYLHEMKKGTLKILLT